jgi:hypothetical protein
MFDDGPIMTMVDIQLLSTLVIAFIFLSLYVTRVRFEKSVFGRLAVANGAAWLLVILGGIMYRLNAPDWAQWVFLPLGFAIPGVLLWWIRTLMRSRGEKGRLEGIASDLRKEGWEMTARGRSGEAQLAFRYAKQIKEALDLSGEPKKENP